MSKEQWEAGCRAGYDYAFQRAYLIKIYANKEKEYGGQIEYGRPPFPTDMYANGVSYGNGFAEGMLSGGSAKMDQILPAECEKLGIKFVTFPKK